MVLNSLDTEARIWQESRPRRARDVSGWAGSWIWVMAAVWCLASKRPPLRDRASPRQSCRLAQVVTSAENKTVISSVCLCACKNILCAKWRSGRRPDIWVIFFSLFCGYFSFIWLLSHRHPVCILVSFLLEQEMTETSAVTWMGLWRETENDCLWRFTQLPTCVL